MFSDAKPEIIHIVKTKGDHADLKVILAKKEKTLFFFWQIRLLYNSGNFVVN